MTMCFSAPKPPQVIQMDKKDLSGTEDAVAAREIDAKKRRLAMSRSRTNLTGIGTSPVQGKTKLGE